MMRKHLMFILWPSFLMAGIMEIVVFAMVDPHDLHIFNQAFDLPRQGIYTLSFFVFWIVCAASSCLSLFLYVEPND
ncbi:MAG: hypothetical protein KGP13_06060 [Burkholderiales bacterium]|nr:hypothetical protein [Burkholderiales bacterium]